MASKFAYETSSEALLRPAEHARAHAPFFKDWVPAVDNLSHGHGLLCAEMSRLAYADEDVVRGALQGIGFTLLEYIGGDSLAQRVLWRGTQAFIAHNTQMGLTVLAFRGTESKRAEDVFFDGETLQQEWPTSEECLVHEGFAQCWDRVKGDVTQPLADRKGELLITGHSLGAAIATLAAIDLRRPTLLTKLITFGSPLVGNDKLAALLTGVEVRRYVDCCDLVTRVPPERFDQEHVSQLFTDIGNIERHDSLGAFIAHHVTHDAAGVIGAAFQFSHQDPHYAHVSPAIYIDHKGTIHPGITDEDRRKDQKEARDNYELSLTSAPFRDLADHTPLNYVSAFTGRLTRSST